MASGGIASLRLNLGRRGRGQPLKIDAGLLGLRSVRSQPQLHEIAARDATAARQGFTASAGRAATLSPADPTLTDFSASLAVARRCGVRTVQFNAVTPEPDFGTNRSPLPCEHGLRVPDGCATRASSSRSLQLLLLLSHSRHATPRVCPVSVPPSSLRTSPR